MATSDRALARLASRVGRHLMRRRRLAATAESCTGGWIAKSLTDIAGSSQWFAEGFITYGNAAKRRSLGVPASALKDGAVSKAVACAMARGALVRSGAHVAVAVTGIAGPGGAVPGKPVGTVWIAWVARHGGKLRARAELRRFRGDRDQVRRKTVRAAMAGILKL